MGAYLSEPLTTKNSADEANNLLASGSSSMQGWRISQEDAHNCILNFDSNTSFFAVYDGHGGSEVAQYCSIHLPTFLKKLSAYKSKDFEQALKDAFIGFDATLLEEKVIEELKKLSDKSNGDEEAIEEDEEEDEDDNVDDLCKEACMPLNEVLQMYKKDKKNPALSKLKEGNCSKPVSPFLKGKRKDSTTEEAAAGPSSSNAAGSASSAEADASSSKNASTPDAADSTVSSSSTKAGGSSEEPESSTAADEKKAADQSDEISDTAGKATKQECAPDSSSSSKAGEDDSKESKPVAGPVVNGDAAESAGKTQAVSSSSSSSVAAQENGVGSSNSAGGSSSSAASGSAVDSSSAGSSSTAATPKGRKAKNGAALATPVDDSDDDDTETDEEFPPVADANETSSTEDGEEDPYCEEGSEEEEDEDEGEGDYDEEDYMNEEDEAFMNNITDEPGKDSGCTAVVALLHEKDLYVANAGDSRCVVCRNGKALEMSFDHKPEDQIEFDRIQKAGGRVTLDGRVNGGLNLSRAIGDHGYKMNKKLPPEEQMISALPDIKKITIGPEDEFMVLACDGIWNFMTSDDVVEFVQERIADPTKKLSEICEEMFDYCLAPHTKGDGTGCDNMTAIIVKFQPSLTGGASRKRAASPEPETTASASDCKKVKTEEAKSSTNGDEKEAAAAVASIAEPAPATDPAEDGASSST